MSEVIIVTGGSRGIGAACVKLAAAEGKTVVFSYRANEQAASAVVDDVESAGGQVSAVQGDVAVEADVIRLFEEADKHGQLVGLINNAGKVDLSQRVEDYTAERLERMFAVNLVGSFLCAREAVRRMSRKHGGRGGSIVNLSSAAAIHAAPNEYVDYAASKGAIDVMTKGLALEVAGEGIRVNAVRPGVIDTEIHASGGNPDRAQKVGRTVPMGRPGNADEVARAVLWLMSDDASYVTGDCLNVSGGR